jgi:hypothetical protein
MTWDNSMQYIEDHSASFGWTKNINDWTGGDRYVGLRYLNGANTWYGWIRLNCFKQDSCYVKDFSSVMATVGISEVAGLRTNLYPNPAKDIFYIDIDPAFFKKENITLTDLSGRALPFSLRSEGDRIAVRPENLPAGCYLIRYSDERCTFVRAIMLEPN